MPNWFNSDVTPRNATQRALADRELLKTGWGLAKEAAVGLVSPYAIPPSSPMQQPSLVDPVVSMGKTTLGGMQRLYNLGAPYIHAPQLQSKMLDKWNTQADKAEADTRTLLHAPEHPGDAAYLAANLGGGLIIPGPKGSGAIKAASNASRLRKIATGATNTAIEFATPLRQGKAAVAIPVQTGIGLGANTLITHSITEHTKKQEAEATFDAKPIEDYMSPEVQTMYADAKKNNDDETQQEILQSVQVAQHNWRKENDLDYDKSLIPSTASSNSAEALTHAGHADVGAGTPVAPEPIWKNPAAVAAGLAAVGLGVAAPRILRKLAANRITQGNPALAGIKTQATPTGLGSKLVGGMVQADQPIREAESTILGEKGTFHSHAAQLQRAKLDRLSAGSLASMTRHAFSTGELPKSSVKLNDSLSGTFEAYAKLKPQEQQVVTNGLLAKTVLNDYDRTGRLETFIPTAEEQAAGIDTTARVAQLRRQVASLEGDKDLAHWGPRIRGFYDNGLAFAQDRGLVETAYAAKFRAERPDYVHLVSTTRTDDTPSLFFGKKGDARGSGALDAFMEREGGIQAGGAMDPVRALPGYLTGLIQKAEVNQYKLDFFDRAHANAALKDVIAPARDGANDYHTVYRNGKAEKWQVADEHLSNALDLSPSALPGHLTTLLSIPKRWNEAQITGLLSPFAPVAALYDSIAGMTLRPKGYKIGTLGLPEQLGNLDPTSWVPIVGLVRSTIDKTIEGMANNLAEHLVSMPEREVAGLADAHPVVQWLGGVRTAALKDRLSAMYASTVSAEMERQGATNAGFMGQNSEIALAHGLTDVSPDFAAQQARQIYREAETGGASFPTTLMAAGRAAGYTAMTVPGIKQLARAYTLLTRLTHDSARYQGFAANIKRAATQDEKQLVASQTRRLGSDLSQKGSYPATQIAANTVMYFNPAMQGIGEIARKFANQPVTTGLNLVTWLGLATALQYTALASDEKLREKYLKASDQERARTLYGPFGIPIAIPPEHRIVWGPHTAIMDELLGVNTGQINTDLVGAMQHWMEFGNSDLTNYSMGQRLQSGLDAANPLPGGGLAATPLAAGAMDVAGINPGMTRYTGNPAPIKTQADQGQEMYGDKEQPQDLLNARGMHFLGDVFGAAVATAVKMGDDFNWAMGHGGTVKNGLEVATSRFVSEEVTHTGPFRDTLFGGYPHNEGAKAPEDGLWFKQRDGITHALNVMNKGMREEAVTSGNPKYGMLNDIDFVEPSFQGTAAGFVGVAASALEREMKRYEMELSGIEKQIKLKVPAQALSTVKERTLDLNYWNAQRRDLIDRMQFLAERKAEFVRQQIQDPTFTWQSFDPKKYQRIPYPLPEPGQEQGQGQGQAPAPQGARTEAGAGAGAGTHTGVPAPIHIPAPAPSPGHHPNMIAGAPQAPGP